MSVKILNETKALVYSKVLLREKICCVLFRCQSKLQERKRLLNNVKLIMMDYSFCSFFQSIAKKIQAKLY